MANRAERGGLLDKTLSTFRAIGGEAECAPRIRLSLVRSFGVSYYIYQPATIQCLIRMSILGILLIILVVGLLIGAVPMGRRNRRYGYGLGGLGGSLLIILIVLLILGVF